MVPNLAKEDWPMKCDVCDQEFDTEAQLDKHKAEMHASEPEMPGKEAPGAEGMDELEEPDFKQAVNE
jgi:hypothetical protein